jgi:hypothetical protein
MRKLKLSEVEFSIVQQREDTPVRGNAIVSDDPDYDRKVEDEIIADYESGNDWAWGCVKVTAKWQGFEGHTYLGACCYKNEKDFIKGGYYPQMQKEALDDLNATLADVHSRISKLVTV